MSKKKEPKTDLIYLTVVVSPEMDKAIDAERGDTPKSRWVRNLIDKHLKRKAKSTGKDAPAEPEPTPAPAPS